jgi:hypothetical protein
MLIRIKDLLNDRGDIPAWVLITVMTAGLVTALWTIADTQLTTLFTKAISAITTR